MASFFLPEHGSFSHFTQTHSMRSHSLNKVRIVVGHWEGRTLSNR